MNLNNRNLVSISSAIGFIACFLPWLSAFGMSFPGYKGDGALIAIALVIVIITNESIDKFSKGQKAIRYLMVLMSVLAVLIAGYSVLAVMTSVGEAGADGFFINMEYGLILTMISTCTTLYLIVFKRLKEDF